MKMYITTGEYAQFNALAQNPANYISDNSDDFQFQWGTNEVQPDTRHPWYASSYTSTGGGRYMSNWLMDTMLNSPGGQDPRMYYYFYRQVDVVPGFGAAPDEEVLECGLQNPPLTTSKTTMFSVDFLQDTGVEITEMIMVSHQMDSYVHFTEFILLEVK